MIIKKEIMAMIMRDFPHPKAKPRETPPDYIPTIEIVSADGQAHMVELPVPDLSKYPEPIYK